MEETEVGRVQCKDAREEMLQIAESTTKPSLQVFWGGRSVEESMPI